jgi:hypothetical protein
MNYKLERIIYFVIDISKATQKQSKQMIVNFSSSNYLLQQDSIWRIDAFPERFTYWAI